jgi:hypothetical protein
MKFKKESQFNKELVCNKEEEEEIERSNVLMKLNL